MKQVWIADCRACHDLSFTIWDEKWNTDKKLCECPNCGEMLAIPIARAIPERLDPDTRRVIQHELGIPVDDLV